MSRSGAVETRGDGGEESREWFHALLTEQRPRLHRYCARMCGSVLDGEDLVQDTLALGAALYGRAPMSASKGVELRLFRVAFQLCMGFIRQDLARREDHLRFGREIGPEELWRPGRLENELLPLVGALHPGERAIVLLHDAAELALLEIAEILGITLLHTKITLQRARAKLREKPAAPRSAPIDPYLLALFRMYAHHFNGRNWEALDRMVQESARIEAVGDPNWRTHNFAAYAESYLDASWKWKLSLGRVDGEIVLLHHHCLRAECPQSAIRLTWDKDRVVGIKDYLPVDYVLRDARIESVSDWLS